MTDLDFDEIDRAVASASGTATATADETPQVSSNSVPVTVNVTSNHAENFHGDVPAAQPSEPVSQISEPESTPEESTSFSVPVTVMSPVVSPALRRSTGRVMDIVHPSKGASVSPLAGSSETPTASSAESNADDLLEEASGPNTPFLPDAKEKVEKRPLGAFSSNSEAAIETPETPADSGTQFQLGSADQPIGQDTPLPDELHSDLLNIETNSELVAPATHEEKAPEVPAETASSYGSSAAAAVPSVQPSIVQQYQEKPSTDNAESGAIFDTETYHKPVTEPAKKSGKIVVVLWVVGLVVVGAGVGAAIYFLVLPHLG